MARFKLGSLLSPSSAGSSAETKKQNRLSFTGFSSSKPKEDGLISAVVSEASIAEEPAKPIPAAVTESSSTPSMTALAQKIAEETEKLEAYMREKGLPVPSFDEDAPADFPELPEEVQKSRREIIRATKQLRDLAVGPRESVRWGIWAFCDVQAIQILNNFGLAKLVPVHGTVTLAELQTKTTLDPVNLARVMRMAMTDNIFREPSPGVIAHTAASRALAEDAALQAWIGFNAEDSFPAAAHSLQALRTYPEALSPTQAGFNVAHGTADKEPMFVTFGKDPVRARRMGQAMASLTGGEGYEVSYLVSVEGGGYDFGAVDAAEGTFVDIGGSHGFVCVALARRYKKMRFVVQDLPKTVDSAPEPVDADVQVAERITFQAHDFFTQQPVKDADVYFFRWIMHNYSTPYAVELIKNLVPALKPGARVLINDHCLLPPGQENAWDEKVIRRMDMVMLALLNAQERSEDEFRALFAAADERFVFKGVIRPKGCRMSIVEAVWQPEKAAVRC